MCLLFIAPIIICNRKSKRYRSWQGVTSLRIIHDWGVGKQMSLRGVDHEICNRTSTGEKKVYSTCTIHEKMLDVLKLWVTFVRDSLEGLTHT